MFQGITPSVPREFVRKLKRIDPGLDCEFNRNYSRFVITQLGRKSGRVPVAIVEGDEGGGYRYPDNRDIRMLREADLHQKTYKRAMLEGERRMKEQKEKEERFVEDELQYAAGEDRRWAMEKLRQAQNDGKANASLRRVDPKPRGFTVKDLRRVS